MTIQLPASGTYILDQSRSSVDFVTRHMFGTGKVTGTFGLAGGEIVVAEPTTASSVRADVDATSFKTKSAARDKAVRKANLLDSANHKQISFASDAVRHSDGTWVLVGQLTVRGTSAPVEFVITEASVDGQTVTVQAVGKVDRYAHGITAGKGMIARHLTINLNAVARAAS